jgi:O-antigen ligase
VLLFVGMAAWIEVSSFFAGGNARPALSLTAACAGALIVARAIGGVNRSVVPACVAAVALALLLRWPLEVMSPRPLAGPFGYANAKAAFFVQASIAALMVWRRARSFNLRALALVVAVALDVVPLSSRSSAASILAICALLAATLLVRDDGRRWIIPILGGLVFAAFAATLLIGIGSPASENDGLSSATSLVGERRVALWRDAIEIIENHPLFGVGPDRFRFVSRTALSDPDAAWAHEEFLQMGAEAGALGMAVMLSLLVWNFLRLWARVPCDGVAILAAIALAALGVHACLDYIMHFPAVPMTTAALVGTGQASSRPGGRL